MLTNKPLTIVISSIIFLGLLIFFLQDTVRNSFWNNDPSYISAARQGITEYSLPKNYKEEKAMCLWDSCTVLLSSIENSTDKIVLMNTGIDTIEEEYKEQIEEKWSQKVAGEKYYTETQEVKQITIRGQKENLRILKGTDSEGRAIIQGVSLFKGKYGNVLVVIINDETTWNQQTAETFMSSIY